MNNEHEDYNRHPKGWMWQCLAGDEEEQDEGIVDAKQPQCISLPYLPVGIGSVDWLGDWEGERLGSDFPLEAITNFSEEETENMESETENVESDDTPSTFEIGDNSMGGSTEAFAPATRTDESEHEADSNEQEPDTLAFDNEATGVMEEEGFSRACPASVATVAGDEECASNRASNSWQYSSSVKSSGTSTGVSNTCRTPTIADVILGRGEQANTHPGNIRFREERDKLKQKYQTMDRSKRRPVAEELVLTVHHWGGSFVTKRDENNWEEVDHDTAVEKCQHALRERRSRGRGVRKDHKAGGDKKPSPDGGDGSKPRPLPPGGCNV